MQADVQMQNSVIANPDQKQPKPANPPNLSDHESARRPRIAVIGDIMVDVDLHCRCERICQEGPWPVLSIERTEQRMGGAGNVLEMLFALDAQAILLGIVGRDDATTIPATGSTIGWQLAPGRTTTKTRLWIDGRLTGPRIDVDNSAKSDQATAANWAEILRQWQPDAVIVADHGKGVVTECVMQMLRARRVPLYIDPIKSTPLPGAGFYPAAIAAGPHEMPNWYRGECIIWKRGPNGLHWCDGPRDGDLPSACRNLVDPLGAGDQFIAALAFQRCLGTDWREAIEWANQAAGIQCERRGCVPVPRADIDTFGTFAFDESSRRTQLFQGSHVAVTAFPG